MENKIYCPKCCKEINQNELLIGVGGCIYCPENENFTKVDKKIIEVVKVGENSGFCREYYQDKKTKRFYAKVTPTDDKENYDWYSTSENYGEPCCPIKDGISFKIIPNKRRPNLQ